MHNPVIKAALEAAARAAAANTMRCDIPGMAIPCCPGCDCAVASAAAVAAFLRALPDTIKSRPFRGNPPDDMLRTRQAYFAGDLAAAVEEAARDVA